MLTARGGSSRPPCSYGSKLANGLRRVCQRFGIRALGVPNQDTRSKQMNMQPRFETTRENTLREIAVLSKILADLVRTVQQLESDIAAEEERARVSDRSDVMYPVLARTLIERRDNLRVTIAALEQRHTERARYEQVATAA